MSRTAGSRRRPVAFSRRLPIPRAGVVALLDSAPERVVEGRLGAVWTGALVTRPVHVGFGRLLEDEDAVVLPVWWEDAEHPHLFPTFDGGLEVRGGQKGTELSLVGSYQPPLGPVGRFADGIAGHRIVVTSLERFLDNVAERLVQAVAGDVGRAQVAATAGT